jgi:aminoglycoside phosphotransferase (APT) family kinase protein
MNEAHFAPLADDAALPQRDCLLDGTRVARRLSRLLGASGAVSVETCERVRVKYKVGASLRVLYRIRVEGRDALVAARTFAPARAREVFEQAAMRAISCGPLRPVALDTDLHTVYWSFPNDRKIAHLKIFSTRAALPRGLALGSWSRSQVVAYSPEKCATAQCLDDRGETIAYAKVYAGDEGNFALGLYNAIGEALPADSVLSVPRPAGYSPTHRTLFLDPVEGRRISDLGGAEMEAGHRRLGAALAALHDVPVPRDLPPFRRLTLNAVDRAARLIGHARPDVEALASRLAQTLAQRWAPTEGPPVCLHGDIHPKNALLWRERIGLVDLDQAGAGPAEADLGSLLAAVRYNRHVGLLSPNAARGLADAFLAGYGSVRPLPSAASLRWHTSAAMLVERALRAVNRLRAPGLCYLGEILADAERLLASGGAS